MEVSGRMQGMAIREARDEDAAAACAVMRRSIAELCGSDHHNNPAFWPDGLPTKLRKISRRGLRTPVIESSSRSKMMPCLRSVPSGTMARSR